MKANIELDIGSKTFASGLLPELIAALRRSRPGDLIAIIGSEKSIGPELEFRLQPALRLLLRAFVAHSATKGIGAHTRTANRS